MGLCVSGPSSSDDFLKQLTEQPQPRSFVFERAAGLDPDYVFYEGVALDGPEVDWEAHIQAWQRLCELAAKARRKERGEAFWRGAPA